MKKKFIIVLLKGIENWIALNTTAHLCAKLGAVVGKEIEGREPTDKSGFKHSGIPQFANAILQCEDASEMRRLIDTAREKKIVVIDYPKEGLDTYTDEEFCDAVEKNYHEKIIYLGCCLYGDTEKVKSVSEKLKLWK